MSVVIIGAGHAGVQAAESLRTEGYEGAIALVDKAEHLPYQRPPLSKDYMKAGGDPTPLPLRGAAFYGDQGIELRLGAEVTSIDTGAKQVVLAGGEKLSYDDVVIAVGAEARRATCAGVDLDGIRYLRTLEDAEDLRAKFEGNQRVVVVGAGFIGLEFAAIAAERGLEVTVIDFAQRAMQRVLTPAMSEHFHGIHGGLGIDLRFDEGLDHFVGEDGHVTGVVGTSGETYPADFVVVGLGVVTDDALPSTAGVDLERGVLVDEYLRTSKPHVYAIGDVAVFPSKHFGGNLRLESVQNATDMAKTVAKTIAGTATPYDISPWFWSNQGPARLQIAGLADPADVVVERGDRSTGKFSQYLFRDGELVAVESVNAPGDHVSARKLFEHGATLSMEQVRDPGFDIKAHVRGLGK